MSVTNCAHTIILQICQVLVYVTVTDIIAVKNGLFTKHLMGYYFKPFQFQTVCYFYNEYTAVVFGSKIYIFFLSDLSFIC